MPQETCVLCNMKLDSKKALQDHFRKHANKEIDIKGQPIQKNANLRGSENFAELHLSPNENHGRGGMKSFKFSSKPAVKGELVSCTKLGSAVREEENPSSTTRCISEVSASTVGLLNDSVQSPRKGTVCNQSKTQSVLCDVCGVSFPSAAAAINHKFKSHPDKPCKFYCSHCGKQFPLKTFLENHLKTEHMSAEVHAVHKCDCCSNEFFNEAAKNYHAQLAHKRVQSVLRPVATPPPSKKIRVNNAGDTESVYYCHLCGIEYILKFNLRKHLEQRHSQEDATFGPGTEIIRCTICEAMFCSKKAYDFHNMYHQPNDLYVISEEHRRMTVSRVDQDFDVRRVQIQIPKSVSGYAKQQKMNVVFNAEVSRFISSTKQPTVSTFQNRTEMGTKQYESTKQSIRAKNKPQILKINLDSKMSRLEGSDPPEQSGMQAKNKKEVCSSSDNVDSKACLDKLLSLNGSKTKSPGKSLNTIKKAQGKCETTSTKLRSSPRKKVPRILRKNDKTGTTCADK